jgi:hypothetical protein
MIAPRRNPGTVELVGAGLLSAGLLMSFYHFANISATPNPPILGSRETDNIVMLTLIGAGVVTLFAGLMSGEYED